MISVLLKKNKDPLKCGSYRPVSLLGCDYKILTKVLAARIGPVISKIIHPDQTGFVAGRQLSSNLRRLLNVIYTAEDNIEPEIVISLDAPQMNKCTSTFIWKKNSPPDKKRVPREAERRGRPGPTKLYALLLGG